MSTVRSAWIHFGFGVTSVVGTIALAACESTASVGTVAGTDAASSATTTNDAGPLPDARGGGEDTGVQTGLSQIDSGGSSKLPDAAASDGAGQACDNTLNLEGCGCAAGSPPRTCYSGPASQAGVGACTLGKQTCLAEGESTAEWGPCLGEGSPTATCLAAGATCGSVSDGCGGTIDCGTCSTGPGCGAGGVPNQCGAASASCPPLQQNFSVGENASHVELEASPEACQAFCNSFPDTACCLWNDGENDANCYSFPEGQCHVAGGDAGFDWGTLCP